MENPIDNNENKESLENKPKAFLITDSRFLWISIILFLMFLVFMLLIFLRTNELRSSPCELCAAKQNDAVVCSITDGNRTFSQTYYPNLTTITEEVKLPGLNLSG